MSQSVSNERLIQVIGECKRQIRLEDAKFRRHLDTLMIVHYSGLQRIYQKLSELKKVCRSLDLDVPDELFQLDECNTNQSVLVDDLQAAIQSGEVRP